MGRLGRDPAFFEHVDGPVATRILSRTQYAFSELPTDTNPYLAYIMTGNYRAGALPRYLRPEFRALSVNDSPAFVSFLVLQRKRWDRSMGSTFQISSNT